MLDLLGITEDNMFDNYRVLNPCNNGDRVLDAFEAEELAPYTELGIGAADALALARVLHRTPAGHLLGNALRDLQMCRTMTVTTRPFDEGCATIIVDTVRGWVVGFPEDTALLWQEARDLLAYAPEYQHVSATEAHRVVAVLQALTPTEALFTVRAAKRVLLLQREGAVALEDALRAVGLIK